MTASNTCQRGRSAPLGPTVLPGGVNFSVYSKHATRLEILLFDSVDAAEPSHVVELDPGANRSFHYWHAFVAGIGPGQLYGFRAHGEFAPERGMRFDADKLLLDPYARRVCVPDGYDRTAAARPGPNLHSAMKSAVVDLTPYDWEGDEPLARPFLRSVIYELHVRGFTRHPNSGVTPERRGTYAGLIEKIPYLVDLGITAVELLPVFAFDAQDAPPERVNYWGYQPVSFFAPHAAYSSRQDIHGPLDEFRDLVKALHRAGIEVILDVVFNHTAEGDERGPTLSYRGLDDRAYYILNGGTYANYTGTGNTLNTNHSVVRRLIQDSLRFWVQEMHVDGFRFDLASILTRDEWGLPLRSPHTLYSIETDPVLANTKLIAEPWDAAGLYQVGSFVGDHWMEWNGRFRDDVRAVVKGDRDSIRLLGDRLLASPDIYGHEGREPEQSINFVTCHDGFTLNDVVSYDCKHNEANGESNRDGHDHNVSWNHGIEGPTVDPQIDALRLRQIKNLLTLTLFSVGTPMLLMGDEVRRTQRGNNNAYCQDNELSWFDWSLVERHRDLLRFTRELVRWRLRTRRNPEPHETLSEFLLRSSYEWHGTTLGHPDWSSDSHSLALTATRAGRRMHLMTNFYWEDLTFEIPAGEWHGFIDTAAPPPEDIHPESAPRVLDHRQRVVARSVVLLIG